MLGVRCGGGQCHRHSQGMAERSRGSVARTFFMSEQGEDFQAALAVGGADGRLHILVRQGKPVGELGVLGGKKTTRQESKAWSRYHLPRR